MIYKNEEKLKEKATLKQLGQNLAEEKIKNIKKDTIIYKLGQELTALKLSKIKEEN